MTRILITGGYGFIGHHLVKRILNTYPNAELLVLDNFSKGKKEFLQDLERLFDSIAIDLRDYPLLANIWHKFKPQLVIHLAAKHFIPECLQHPDETFSTNVFVTQTIVDLCNQTKPEQLIFISSASVYGSQNTACKEEDSMKTSCVYGLSKALGETTIRIACAIPWTIFRLFNVYGPEETNPHFLVAILEQLKDDNRLLNLGNLDTYRDYIHVDDVVTGLTHAIHSPAAYHKIFNLGTGIPTSGQQIIQYFQEILQEKITVHFDKERKRVIDIPYLCASIDEAKNYLNWYPQISLSEGLKKMIPFPIHASPM